MSDYFKELDHVPTRIGALSLRRRRHLSLGVDVYEIMLGNAFLMTSLFTESEVALARLGLDALEDGNIDVAIGGLGLGYTADAVLQNPEVRSLLVIEALPPVIDWHRRGLVPLGAKLSADQRCRFLNADFFALVPGDSLDPQNPGLRFHAILIDIDHSPRQVLHPSHDTFYRPEGLARLIRHLRPRGVFALWSNDPPDTEFLALLHGAFATAVAHTVTFPNPIQDREALQTIYVAQTGE
jgi:spermidine synthase